MFDIVIPLLAMQEMGLVEQALGNEEIAAEWFKQAAISDKQKSRIKRRMFESRKAASKWKKPNSNKSALTTASAVPQLPGISKTPIPWAISGKKRKHQKAIFEC